DADGRRCWVRGAITSFEAVDSHRLVKLTLQRDRVRINNTNQDDVGVDGPIELSINSYREEPSGISVFGNRAPVVDSWFLAQSPEPTTAPTGNSERIGDGMAVNASKRASKKGSKGKRQYVRTPTRTELLSLSDVLKRAEPAQGIMPLCEAWGTYLLQRACLVFEGMLVMHVYLTDAKVKRVSGSRFDANEWVRDGKYLRPNQPHLHSNGKRTHGIVRAIADTVTCDRLLPPKQHRYTHLDTSSSYMAICWPGLTQQTVDTLELETLPRKTAANVTPVNSVIKILSTAAVLGRRPTCASALVCSKRGGERPPVCVVNSTPMARMEMWFLSADTNSGEAARSQSAYCNLMYDAQFCLHTMRSTLQNSIDLSGCIESLRRNQAPFQCYIRLQHRKWQALSQAHEHKVKQGRILPEHLMYLIHDMLEGFIRSTWKPFERAIQRGLETQGRQMPDFDGLIELLAHRRPADGFNMAQPEGDCVHLEVDWVTTLAHHMLEAEQFTTYDVANLEILVHLYAYYLLPVRPEALVSNLASQVWAKRTMGPDGCVSFILFQDIANAELGKIAMSGGGDDTEPMKTCVPVPLELNRPMLTILFLCRAMRAIHFGTPVPDRLVGLSGGANYQVSQTTFREKVLNEIGRNNLGIPYYASYSNRSTAVTEIFAKTMKMPYGEQQDFIASSMKELHSSVSAGKSAYRQFEASLSSRVQNRGKRSQFVAADGEGHGLVDVLRPPPALRPMSLAGSDGGSGGGVAGCGGGAQAIAEMAAAAIANMQHVHAASLQGAIANMQNTHTTTMQQMQATHALSLQQFQKVHKTTYRRTSHLHSETLQQMSAVHSQTLQQNAAAHHAYLAQQQQQAQRQWAQQAMFCNFLHMQQRGMYPPYGHPPQMLQSAPIGHNPPQQMLPAAQLPLHMQHSPPGYYHYSQTAAQSQMSGPPQSPPPPPGTPPM
ncbi:hypothetical protein JKP88DRAFT_321358, partial [Tribonema minus]